MDTRDGPGNRASMAGGAMAALALAAAVQGQTVLYVDDDAPEGGDGASWNTAYRDLQKALDKAQQLQGTVEVRVGEGVYTPDAGTKERSRRYLITATTGSAVSLMLIVRGGFAGIVAGNPDARDPTQFVSVISGDLNGDDGPDWENRSDNSRSLLSATGNRNAFLFDGLTFRGAEGDWSSSASATIEIIDRSIWPPSTSGSRFAGCTFESNRAIGPLARAAVVTASAVALTFQACTFANNIGASGSGAAAAAVRFVGHNSDSPLNITDSRFHANLGEAAGAVQTVTGKAIIQRSSFRGNTSLGTGGALSIGGPALVYNSEFAVNTASLDGGALYTNNYRSCTIANSTFVSNYAAHGGACAALSGYVDVHACVLWANDAWAGGPAVAAFSPWQSWVEDCIVQGGQSGLLGNAVLIGGSTAADPLFRDPSGPDGDPETWEDNDYRLLASSPGIDTGDQWFNLNSLTDLSGRARFYDLIPGGGIIDIGCYELQPAPCPADFDENGWINGDDYDAFASALVAGSTLADINLDGFVNGDDFDLFVMRFDGGC